LAFLSRTPQATTEAIERRTGLLTCSTVNVRVSRVVFVIHGMRDVGELDIEVWGGRGGGRFCRASWFFFGRRVGIELAA
jgi:hypothetical protein